MIVVESPQSKAVPALALLFWGWKRSVAAALPAGHAFVIVSCGADFNVFVIVQVGVGVPRGRPSALAQALLVAVV